MISRNECKRGIPLTKTKEFRWSVMSLTIINCERWSHPKWMSKALSFQKSCLHSNKAVLQVVTCMHLSIKFREVWFIDKVRNRSNCVLGALCALGS